MFCGESVPVQMKAKTAIMDYLIDWFGRDFRIVDEDRDRGEITISLKCNYTAMFYWALQYGAYVEILSPKELRKELGKTIKKMNEKYNKQKG